MTKLDEYINGYVDYSVEHKFVESSFEKFAENCKEDGLNVTRTDYDNYVKSVKSKCKSLKEAIFLNDDNDPRSFDDIYGEEGLQLEGDENKPSTIENLGPAEIQKLRDLANQILDIVGSGTEPDEMTGTPDFEGGESTSDED